MSDQLFQSLALGLYLVAMLGIGYYAYRQTSSHEDYMLADRNLKPWIAALRPELPICPGG